MKESKLDPHREFIISKLQARTPINRICKDLAKEGCPVSRSYLTEWIAAAGISYMPCKRGRPVGARLFSLLPAAGEDPQVNMAHMFLFSLQEGVPENIRIGFRKQSLDALGLPSCSMHPEQWDDLVRYADLSDPELLLLALLRSDLEAPPFTQGGQAVGDWYCKLAALAMELRASIAAAIASRKS
jgi:hypothetical protein